MQINIVTLFPEFFSGPLATGLMQKAVDSGIVEFCLHNPRAFTDDKRQTIDDRPYGGGPGMVMLLEPLTRTLRSLGFGTKNYALHPEAQPGRLLMMSPRGKPFNQKLAEELSREKRVTILCGRYEGFDARLNELFPVEEVSLGDFVLNGGEAAALSVIESAARLLPGFMGHDESGLEESFSSGLLEYPHYTRPEVFEGLSVPAVLRSGDHGQIALWRKQEALRTTLKMRPELLETARLSEQEQEFIRTQPRKLAGRNLYVALLHYPVLNREKNSVTVSLTNLDIHDIARSSCSYGLGGFFAVTPLKDQRQILQEMLGHWVDGAGAVTNPDRKTALSRVIALPALEDAIAFVRDKHGEEPLVWGSSAQGSGTIGFDEARKFLYTRPAILLLGTGHGLAPQAVEKCTHLLPPLRWASSYNHFSVRCAAAVLFDRILGELG